MARHPSYLEGFNDFYKGQIVNPYRSIVKGKYMLNSIQSKEWQSGFDCAYYDNLKESVNG